MTIPATASAAWAVIGIKENDRQQITFSDDEIQLFFRAIERAFNLPVGVLMYKDDFSCLPLKRWNSTSLTDIRRVIVVLFEDETAMEASGIAHYLGITRTMPCKLYPVAKRLIEERDAAFLHVYNTIKRIMF
jgi:hypothetical protein